MHSLLAMCCARTCGCLPGRCTDRSARSFSTRKSYWSGSFRGRHCSSDGCLTGHAGPKNGTAERLLWSWSIAVMGLFTLSGFKLDHYVFPAAPALCLLCAAAWNRARSDERHPVGIVAGLAAIPLLLIAAGIVLIPGLDRVPLELPAEARLLPIVLLASGLAMLGQIGREWRPAA